MDSDWAEVTRIRLPHDGLHANTAAATALCFDTYQDLIWTGTQYGRVDSFYGPELRRYTAYRASAASEGPVKSIMTCEKGVVSVSTRCVHLAERRGKAIWHVRDESFVDLRCMSFSAPGSAHLVVAGCQQTMVKINIEKGDIINIVPTTERYTQLRAGSQYICAATVNGNVQLLDPKTLQPISSWNAHAGWINDLDTNASFLVTCGWSPRQQYGNMLDPLAKVFDLKTLTPLPPVPFHAGAGFVRLHPRMQTTGVIASQSGQLQLVDIMNSSMVNVRQVGLLDAFLIHLELAPSGDAFAIADSVGCIHLWGSPTRVAFTEFAQPLELPDSFTPYEIAEWSDDEPLNTIGMPFYRESLLSAWPGHVVSEVGAPPGKIDHTIISGLIATEFGGFTINTRQRHRNEVEDTRAPAYTGDAMSAPKFLSEQAKDRNGHEQLRHAIDISDHKDVDEAFSSYVMHVPPIYRSVEIKYSKFGVDDFDFEYYNRTKYSGLETHIGNSYLNPLLQLLRFTTLVRNMSLHHTASHCPYETCLLCEIGFLIDMLEKASGQNCQASNLLKVFGSLPHTASLGLLEETVTNRQVGVTIQVAARYIAERISSEHREIPPRSTKSDELLMTSVLNGIKCCHCGKETVRGHGVYVHELLYPSRPVHRGSHKFQSPSFSQVLKASVERQEHTRGWCDRCKRYQQLSGRRTTQNIPPVMLLNTAIHSAEARKLWAQPGWLPQQIGIINEQGQFFCYQGRDLHMHLQRGVFAITVFDLIGTVLEVSENDGQKSHAVAMINVALSSTNPSDEPDWHLFNDFLVRDMTSTEACQFEPAWKLPVVLAYQAKSARHRIDDTWKQNLDTTILLRVTGFEHQTADDKIRSLEHIDEIPAAGAPVGIDSEFVSLQREEIEIKPDGSRAILRPAKSGLARVSVLRQVTRLDEASAVPATGYMSEALGQIPNFEPFIDDYIHIADPIVDYLTAFSGIGPGDLDPRTSPYVSTGRLIPLKRAYKKIWLLLNLGCVFVGHGLLKDFRTINIHVPKHQVVDTVDLYFMKARQRKLSLRFLSWFLLGEVVQTQAEDGNEGKGHDSIEDARAALRLWEVWKQFDAQGIVEEIVASVYNKGRDLGFKVPSQAAVEICSRTRID